MSNKRVDVTWACIALHGQGPRLAHPAAAQLHTMKHATYSECKRKWGVHNPVTHITFSCWNASGEPHSAGRDPLSWLLSKYLHGQLHIKCIGGQGQLTFVAPKWT